MAHGMTEFNSCLGGRRVRPTVDPDRCHCGKPALYKVGTRGYCRDHKAEADTEAMKGRKPWAPK